MKTRKRMVTVVIVLAMLMQLVAATYVQAASKKTTATNNAAYVNQVNRNGGLVGVPAKVRKNIKNTITRWQFCRILKNLYGNRINLANTWIDEAVLTQSWACGILSNISSQMGVKVNWSGGSAKAKVNLGTACKLIVLTINSSSKLKPAKWA